MKDILKALWDDINMVKVISNRRITLPEGFCREFDLHEGDTVAIVRMGDGTWRIGAPKGAALDMGAGQ